MIKVVILGTGNVAWHLSQAFSERGDIIGVAGIAGWNRHALKRFGSRFPIRGDFEDLPEADVYLIAVSDDAIASVSRTLGSVHGLVVHTSGSIPLSALSEHDQHGVFYPLQTFSKVRQPDFAEIPICLESSSEKGLGTLRRLAGSISGNVHEISTEQRKWLHLSAVFANNFSNHMCQIAHELCEMQDVPFSLLKPLLWETVRKLEGMTPREAQTGPARRRDAKVLENHMALLEASGHQEVYRVLTQSIQKTYGKEL